MRRDLWQRHQKTSHNEFDPSTDILPTTVLDVSGSEDDTSGSWSHRRANSYTATSSSVQRQNLDSHEPDSPSTIRSGQGSANQASQNINLNFGGQPDLVQEPSADPNWVHELQNWMIDYSWTETSGFNEPDIDWFLNNQYHISDDFYTNAHEDNERNVPSNDQTAKSLIQIVEHSNRFEHMPPMFLQEAPTKLFVPKTGDFSAPNCGFRTCSALSENHRTTLLVELQKMIDIDVHDRLFSLNSLKQGIHLYFRHINIEHNFLHHEFFIPSCEETRRARLDVCGLDSEPGAVFYWSIISIGWTLMRSEEGHEHRMAVQIQRALRKTVINVGDQSLTFQYLLTVILA